MALFTKDHRTPHGEADGGPSRRVLAGGFICTLALGFLLGATTTGWSNDDDARPRRGGLNLEDPVWLEPEPSRDPPREVPPDVRLFGVHHLFRAEGPVLNVYAEIDGPAGYGKELRGMVNGRVEVPLVESRAAGEGRTIYVLRGEPALIDVLANQWPGRHELELRVTLGEAEVRATGWYMLGADPIRRAPPARLFGVHHLFRAVGPILNVHAEINGPAGCAEELRAVVNGRAEVPLVATRRAGAGRTIYVFRGEPLLVDVLADQHPGHHDLELRVTLGDGAEVRAPGWYMHPGATPAAHLLMRDWLFRAEGKVLHVSATLEGPLGLEETIMGRVNGRVDLPMSSWERSATPGRAIYSFVGELPLVDVLEDLVPGRHELELVVSAPSSNSETGWGWYRLDPGVLR
jgi:hypothetical protein